MGQGAAAKGLNSVAIGNGSVAGDANTVSLGAVGAERRLTNLAAGNLSATSTDGVNGAQLFATNQAVSAVQTTANTALADAQNAVTYDDASRTAVTLDAGGATTMVHNLAAGVATDDAVNVGQLTNAIATINGGAGIVAQNNTAGAALPVASGANSLSAGAGSQSSGFSSTALGLDARAVATNSVAIGNGSVADQDNTVSVGAVGAERRIVNVAAGTVSVTSTDAVNGSQLNTTNLATANAQSTSTAALSLGQNSVQYTDSGHTAVTLNPGGGPVALHNLAPGVANSDAATVGQVQQAAATTLAQSTAITDRWRVQLQHQFRGDTAAAMASGGLVQAMTPGHSLITAGVAEWGGEEGVAIGFSHRTTDGKWVVRGSGAYSTEGSVGASAVVGYEF